MMMNKKTLYVAVAASLGVFAASQANAAVTTFASEIPAGSDIAGTSWAVPVTSFAPTTANPLYLQFSLTGGASYDTITSSSLVCSAASGTTGTLTPANVQLVAGGVGTANVTFVVTAITAAALMVGCTLTNGSAHLGTWPASVGEKVVITYGGNLSPTATLTTAIATAASLFTNAATASTNTALVASGFISFSTAGSNTATTTTAKIGSFTLQLNANNLSNGTPANANTAVSGVATAITVSLAGAPLAAAAAAGITAGVFITYQSAAGGVTGCGGTKLVSAAGGSSAITFSAISPDPAAGATSGYEYTVCMSVTGALIPAGTITVGVNGTPNNDALNANGSAYQVRTLITTGTTLGTITHNGATTEVVNLPPSTNADAGYLRVYNNSTGSGAVTVTVYNEAGTALATNCSLGSLAAQSTMVDSVGTIETTCSITPPASGRYRMVVNGAFSSMRAQGLARTGGVLVNLSGDTSSNGN